MTGASAKRLTGTLIGPAFEPHWSPLSLFGFNKPALIEVEPATAADLFTIVDGALRDAGFASCVVRPSQDFDDGRYYLPTQKDISQLMKARSPTAGYGSVVDLFDCDDFAYNFRGFSAAHRFRSENRDDATTPFAIGLLWGRGIPWIGPEKHAFNVAVLQDESVWLIDTSEKNRKCEKLCNGIATELYYLVI